MTYYDWTEEGCNMRWACCGDCSQCEHKYDREDDDNEID